MKIKHKTLLGFCILFMLSFVMAQVYEGDKIYFFQSGSRIYSPAVGGCLDINYTFEPDYVNFNTLTTSFGFYLPCVGEYSTYLHSNYDAVNCRVGYEKDNDGVQNDYITLTKTVLGDGTYSYSGSFICTNQRMFFIGCGSVITEFYLNSYFSFDNIGHIPLISINQNYSVELPTLRDAGGGHPINQTFIVYSDVISIKEHIQGCPLTSLNYLFCDGSGVEWVICVQTMYDTNETVIYDMRSCGFWVNLSFNPESQVIPIPDVNSFNDLLILDNQETLNLSLHVLGMEYSYIDWYVYEYATENIYDYVVNVSEYILNPLDLGINSKYITVQARIYDLCDHLFNSYTWYVHVKSVKLDVSGKVYRYNESDTWNLNNGSICFGNDCTDIINSSYSIRLPEGCYFINIFDYELSDSWNSPNCYPFSIDTIQNFYVPYGFNKTYNLSVCLYDEYLRVGMDGIRVNMYRNGYFYELNYTGVSGCCTFTDLWFNDVVVIHPVLPSNKTCQDYSYVVKGNKFINITVYNASLSEQIQFRVYNKANYNAITGAEIVCMDRINNVTYTVSTANTGLAYMSLVLGNEYFCSANKLFFHEDTYYIANFSQRNIDEGHSFFLDIVSDIYTVHIYTYYISENNLGNVIINETFPLSGVEVNIEGIDNNYVFNIVVDGFGHELIASGSYKFTGSKSGYLFLESESDYIVRVNSNNQEIHLYFKEPNQQVDRWVRYENMGFIGMALYILDIITGIDFSDIYTPKGIFTVLLFFLPPIFFITIFLVFIIMVRRAFSKND